ncbi:hypothetical protein B1158_01845 [Enterococcus faecium]|nr:hypothetical protein B1158_01845 [Enterococcus faecium]
MGCTKSNLSQNVVHSDSDLILHNSSVLIDKEPFFFLFCPNYSKISLYQHHLTKSQKKPSSR